MIFKYRKHKQLDHNFYVFMYFCVLSRVSVYSPPMGVETDRLKNTRPYHSLHRPFKPGLNGDTSALHLRHAGERNWYKSSYIRNLHVRVSVNLVQVS